jgi:hypothetical protein
VRKAKCDARRPTCSPCRKRNQPCEYDTEADIDRYTSLKRKHTRLARAHDEILELFDMIRFRPMRDARSILDRITSSHDLADTLSFIRHGDLLLPGVAGRPASLNISTTASLLSALHPLAYPALGPLSELDAGLGQKRSTMMQVTLGPGICLTQNDIDAAR